MSNTLLSLVTVPVIHLNGSDAATLREGYFAAYDAVQAALAAVQATSPNQRDYYVARPDPDIAWHEARAAHGARLEALQALSDTFAALVIGIDEQVVR